jgi:glutamate synthase (NADPH/NADH) large chain
MVEAHAKETGSPLAAAVLRDWDLARRRFWQICPKEMVSRLAEPLAAAG